MRFRLYYEGPLESNNVRRKSELRHHFSKQLEELWSQSPLSELRNYTIPARGQGSLYIGRDILGATYIPIATPDLATIAELDILFIRPGEPGQLLKNGADLDNRLKTLFDALQPPHASHAEGLKESGTIYCLATDDKLFTRISVETDRLLKPVMNENDCILIIQVNVRPTKGLMATVSLMC